MKKLLKIRWQQDVMNTIRIKRFKIREETSGVGGERNKATDNFLKDLTLQ